MVDAEITIEFPDFGFGPASTAISVIRRLALSRRCVVVSTGSALDLARRTLTETATVDVDTFDPERMSAFAEAVDDRSFVLSVTNPPFASWALRAGYKVGVLDTLAWLWDDQAATVDGASFYVSQEYWGRSSGTSRPQHVRATADKVISSPAGLRRRGSGRALIAFGGMGLPLDPDLPLEFATWVLEHSIAELLNDPRVHAIDVVGGHPRLATASAAVVNNHAVTVLGMLPVDRYREVLRDAHIVLATPGIATIHELNWANSRALLLPGANVSQVLQLRDAVTVLDCAAALEWPDAAEMCGAIRGLPEEDAMRRVADHARAAMSTASVATALRSEIRRALGSARPTVRIPRSIAAPGRLPSVSDAVSRSMRDDTQYSGVVAKRGQRAKLAH